MCTYVLFRDVFGPGTFAFAGNRDERFDRPFEAPRPHDAGGHAATYARDHLGGTWLGMTGRHVVAITNAPRSHGFSPTRSRGLLVRDLLAEPGVTAAARALERAVAAESYDGFNIVLAGAGELLLASHGDDGLSVAELPPGAHVVEHRAGGARALEGGPIDGTRDPEPALRALARTLLAGHEPVDSTGHPPCRHEAERGTVASMLLFSSPLEPSRSFFLFSRGPACKADLLRVALPEG